MKWIRRYREPPTTLTADKLLASSARREAGIVNRLERMDKDGSMTPDTERDHSADERLRAELLISGLSDWVSLAEVQQIISHFQLAAAEGEDVERFGVPLRLRGRTSVSQLISGATR